ncbi:hypothetical protein BJ322DRAFT_1105103 [Thelephora terrestris]|uniref:Uncharacterized protein n=1 Tax=Thelephora terrestris TaxID=56493 RepID=A0A9P6L9W1_9AGAM|nr:hypothetical protein BJ322DRAFT_1105103 [Thelephora terrestris]
MTLNPIIHYPRQPLNIFERRLSIVSHPLPHIDHPLSEEQTFTLPLHGLTGIPDILLSLPSVELLETGRFSLDELVDYSQGNEILLSAGEVLPIKCLDKIVSSAFSGLKIHIHAQGNSPPPRDFLVGAGTSPGPTVSIQPNVPTSDFTPPKPILTNPSFTRMATVSVQISSEEEGTVPFMAPEFPEQDLLLIIGPRLKGQMRLRSFTFGHLIYALGPAIAGERSPRPENARMRMVGMTEVVWYLFG